MRRIAAALVVLALCAGMGAWALASAPRDAIAITPTPSFTPTSTPTPSVHTFTNAEALTDEVTVFFFTNFPVFPATAALDQNAPGCGIPSVQVGGISNNLAYYGWAAYVTWPTACVDPGESFGLAIQPPARTSPAPAADFSPVKRVHTFTNSEGPTAALDVTFTSIHFILPAVTVETNAAGCGSPSVSLEHTGVLVPVSTPHFTQAFEVIAHITWPTACVDTGEPVSVAIDYRSLSEPSADFSPPFLPTPTPTPFPSEGVSLLLDCDVNTAGIQSTCTVPIDAGTVDVDVVVVNNGPAFSLGAMNFNVEHPSVARLDAQPSPPCLPPGLDCNPNLNQSTLTGMGWVCGPPYPLDDWPAGGSESSFISCFNAIDAQPIPADATARLAHVRYNIAPGATEGSEPLTLSFGNLGTEIGLEKLACFPGPDVCLGATITLGPPAGLPTNTPTPTSTPFPATPAGGVATPVSAVNASATPIGDAFLMMDCALSIPGIQSECTYLTTDDLIDVGIVFQERFESGGELQVVQMSVLDPDTSRLYPPAVTTGPTTDRNPDLIQGTVGLAFTCAPLGIPPDNDTGMFGPGTATSYIDCFDDPAPPDGAATNPGVPMHVTTVRYEVVAGALPGSVSLQFPGAEVHVAPGVNVANCNSFGTRDCAGATITLIEPPEATPTPAALSSSDLDPTPNARYFAIDCDLGDPGIQDECTYGTDAGIIDVGVVVVNHGGPATSLCCFNFEMHNPDTSRLFPPFVAGSPLDSNPDANQFSLSPVLQCSPPPPDNDTGADGPGTSVSFISCYDGTVQGPPLAVGGSLLLARVRYNTTGAAGVVPLTLEEVAAYANDLVEVGSCAPTLDAAAVCVPAQITLVQPPTATPTVTPTQAPPAVVKVPEGVGDNVDLSVPKANLWICELGPCDGPGEGELRVVEYATDVQDGLGAYEFTVEYDNFVIASVNPCDIVFGPFGAGSARGPVDEVNTSAINSDCAPDPGPGGGTCAYSHILENVIHFGCATAGQTPGPTGDFSLASLLLIPHEDLVNDLFPGNDNGVLTIIKDNGCELVDIFGHPVTGSINGGLVPTCGDLAVTVRILEGDLDLNCTVDVTDAQLIAGKYGAFFGSLLYSKWYDLEPALHDLDIDIKDLQKVFGRNGSVCELPIPPQPPLDPPAPF